MKLHHTLSIDQIEKLNSLTAIQLNIKKNTFTECRSNQYLYVGSSRMRRVRPLFDKQ